jgi:UDP-arabinose 4-epimerase
MSETHVLVAGGAGFIGSHIAKMLRRSGFVPVVLDNLSTGSREVAAKYGPFHEGGMEDSTLVRSLIARYGIRAAILLSAHAYVGESTRDPRKYYTNNIAGSIAFLNALLDSGAVSNLIFSSSCSIYGVPAAMPITESSSKDPLSPYAETKYFLEQMLAWYAKAYGLNSMCLRYFNAAGADEEGELGENHVPETHMIPLAILAALGHGPLTIFGSDYPTPDGTAIRDYVHVTDLAEAHVRALRYLTENDGRPAQCRGLNLGSGRGASNLEVVRMVEECSGRKVPFTLGARREGDAPELVASPERARQVLGWEPVHSDLRNIVTTAWKWISQTRAL